MDMLSLISSTKNDQSYLMLYIYDCCIRDSMRITQRKTIFSGFYIHSFLFYLPGWFLCSPSKLESFQTFVK